VCLRIIYILARPRRSPVAPRTVPGHVQYQWHRLGRAQTQLQSLPVLHKTARPGGPALSDATQKQGPRSGVPARLSSCKAEPSPSLRLLARSLIKSRLMHVHGADVLCRGRRLPVYGDTYPRNEYDVRTPQDGCLIEATNCLNCHNVL
jgi:hypothetical protein